jgi:hypothetical protein
VQLLSGETDPDIISKLIISILGFSRYILKKFRRLTCQVYSEMLLAAHMANEDFNLSLFGAFAVHKSLKLNKKEEFSHIKVMPNILTNLGDDNNKHNEKFT